MAWVNGKFHWTVYARKEPTTDSSTMDMIKAAGGVLGVLSKKQDVQVYKDRKAKLPLARYPWYYRHRPTKRNKQIVVNCVIYKLVWLEQK